MWEGLAINSKKTKKILNENLTNFLQISRKKYEVTQEKKFKHRRWVSCKQYIHGLCGHDNENTESDYILSRQWGQER